MTYKYTPKTETEYKIYSAIFGLAVADALGVPVEFKSRESLRRDPVRDMREYGTHLMPRGCFSDDTSMTLAALDALSEEGDDEAVMRAFCRWYYSGEYTATGEVFDIGGTCAAALERYKSGISAEGSGLRDAHSNGNGSLMRILPHILKNYFSGAEDAECRERIERASSLTHAHEISRLGCLIYSEIISALLARAERESVMLGISRAAETLRTFPFIGEYSRIFDKSFRELPE